MERTYDLSGQFAMNEEAAIEWLNGITANEGEDPVSGEYLGIPEDWRSIDDEFTCDRLVTCAQGAKVITGPEGMEIFFDYSGNEDGGSYGYLLDFGYDLRVSEYANDFYKVAGRDERGTSAALEVLREAVAYGNSMLAKTARFVAAHAGVNPDTGLEG